MTDLSALSDAQLQALYGAPSSMPDVSKMSDADLMAAYHGPSFAEDAAKSIGSGLGSATIGTLGMAGDIRSALGHGVDALGSKMGVDLSPLKTAASYTPLGALNALPTSAQVQSTVTDPIVSPDYQPRYEFNRVLKKGAEFLPSVIGGPESLGAKLLTRVAVPAVASEIGENVAGPYGGVAGALIGGAGASKIANSFNEARALKAATPALADVKSEATNAYDSLTARNVATPIHQSTLDNLASDITTTLNNKGIRPSTAQSIHNAVEEIKSPATAGAADVADLVAARQSVKGLLSAPDANKAGAFVALNKIEQAIEQNSPGTMTKIREADKNYAAARAVEALDKRTASADLRAASVDSGMNVGNKIRQKVAGLLEGSEAKYLSAETKAELEKIVRGKWTQNGMRIIANMMGGGGGIGSTVVGLGALGAGGASGHPELGLLPLGGIGLRFAGNRSILKQAAQASQGIRLRSPLGQQNPPILPPRTSTALSALLPALLANPRQ